MGKGKLKKEDSSQNPLNSAETIGNSEQELLNLVVDILMTIIMEDYEV